MFRGIPQLIMNAFVACGTIVEIANAQSPSIDFAHEIVPILTKHCATCHTGVKSEGGLSLNSRAVLLDSGVVDLENASTSRLLEVVSSKDINEQMPPADRPRLSTEEIATLRRWVDAGLPWEESFSFEERSYEPPLKPRRVALPPEINGRGHAVDRILDNYLQENQLDLPEAVNDETFLRRVTLDLIGLLPSDNDVREFVRDHSVDKRARVIDRLLNQNIHYSEHWLSFFNDLLRNDYSGTGFITGGRKQITQWLYESLLVNKSFDQMTRELVAPPSDASRGYIDGIQWRGNTSAGQTIPIQFSQSVAQSFLGINMKCASCHDSFIDRWTLKDAYGLAAIYADNPLDLYRCDKPTGQQQSAAWPFPELGKIDPKASREERLRQLADLMTHPDNGRFARTIVNRLWHRLMGRGLVHPLDAMQSEPWNEDLLDYLANEFVASGYDVKATLRLIATSQAYQSVAAENSLAESSTNYVYRGPLARRLTAEQFMDAVWQLTDSAPGSFDAPVFRVDQSLIDIEKTHLSGRWIWGELTDNQSPAGESLLLQKSFELPAEVSSGGAIVTCDNEFALFIGNREIATGNDWTKLQLLALRDVLSKGSNTLVFRVSNGGAAGTMGPAGLYFEARLQLTNGTSLTISSDETWEYHRVVPPSREGRMSAPKNGWKPVNIVPTHPAWQEMLDREGRYQLAIAELQTGQTPMVRASLVKNDALMKSLGRPMREQIVSMRPSGLTTLEALDLANEQTLSDAFNKGGENWSKRHWKSTEELIESLFLSTLSRQPTDAEQMLFIDHLGDEPSASMISDALWSLCMLPEFMFVH